MKKPILIISFICIIFAICGIFTYKREFMSEIPYSTPKTKIEYNGKNISSKSGDENWINRFGGNTSIAGYSYDIGKNSTVLNCLPNSYITISFSSSPKKIRVLKWVDREKKPDVYQEVDGVKSHAILLPNEEGEYIFEIIGYWDNDHYTSNILNILIEKNS